MTIGMGALGLLAALLLVVSRYYETQKSRLEAERAIADAERARNSSREPPTAMPDAPTPSATSKSVAQTPGGSPLIPETSGGSVSEPGRAPPPARPSSPSTAPSAGATQVPPPTPAIGLRGQVTSRRPYPASYSGAPTDKISVQYAVIEVLRQVGIRYDFRKSQSNVGEAARRWITPQLADVSCETALESILGPLGLTYVLEGDTVVLRRK